MVITHIKTETGPSKGFSINGVSGFVQTTTTYSASSKDEALVFLAKQDIKQRKCYINVETPEGTWGKDIWGIYRADCEFIEDCTITDHAIDCLHCKKGYTRRINGKRVIFFAPNEKKKEGVYYE